MTDQILKKLEEHDKQFAKLGERLDDHDKKFDRVIKAVVDNTERFDKFDKVDQKLENVATKDDVSDMINTLDEIVGLAKKKDEELTFMGERVDRVEKDVAKIKPLVGLETS